MRARGIYSAPSQNEVMFLSSEHGETEIARTLEAMEGALGELRDRALRDELGERSAHRASAGRASRWDATMPFYARRSIGRTSMVRSPS